MKTKRLSPFVETAKRDFPSLFVQKLQKISTKTREETAKVIGRPAVDEAIAAQKVAE